MVGVKSYGSPRRGSHGSLPKHSSSPYSDIATACAAISLPMIALSGVLLGLVFAYQVTPNSDSGTYLVEFSATRLITIASWTSSVAPLLPGFIATLLSFPAARHLQRSSERDRNALLPTPYQLNLYLQLLYGGVGALWQWVKYMFWRKREKQVPVVVRLVMGLTVATLIGLAILAADTWLHVTTSTIIFSTLTTVPAKEVKQYGRGIYSNDCSTRTNNDPNPCTVDNSASSRFLTNAAEAYQTLNNHSSFNQVSSFLYNGKTYAYLIHANIPPNVDFQASTFAVSTQCKPFSRACNLRAAYGASTPFNCTSAFQGDITAIEDLSTLGYRRASSPIGLVFFEDSTQTKNLTRKSKDMNPYYFGTWARADTQGHLPNAPINATSTILQNDAEIVTPVHGGMAWVLSCSTTVHEVLYNYINNTVSNPAIGRANDTIGRLIMAPTNEEFGLSNLEIATNIASFSVSSQELADKWANSYSQIALGLSSGVFSSRSNREEQIRTEILVARIPKAPLFTLVGLNLVYAVLGIALALYAIFGSRLGDGSADVRERLTIPGVVAECFEETGGAHGGTVKAERFFVERKDKGLTGRLGVAETEDGGWQFLKI